MEFEKGINSWPSWKPTHVESPANLAALAATYSSRARAFVVYRFGTVVYSDTSLARSDGDYNSTLVDAIRKAPSFNVREMQQGNYLILFDGPVTGLVEGYFYSQNREVIQCEVAKGGLLLGESVALADSFSAPDDHYYVGLYARAKLYRDVESCQIVQRFAP